MPYARSRDVERPWLIFWCSRKTAGLVAPQKSRVERGSNVVRAALAASGQTRVFGRHGWPLNGAPRRSSVTTANGEQVSAERPPSHALYGAARESRPMRKSKSVRQMNDAMFIA